MYVWSVVRPYNLQHRQLRARSRGTVGDLRSRYYVACEHMFINVLAYLCHTLTNICRTKRIVEKDCHDDSEGDATCSVSGNEWIYTRC